MFHFEKQVKKFWKYSQKLEDIPKIQYWWKEKVSFWKFWKYYKKKFHFEFFFWIKLFSLKKSSLPQSTILAQQSRSISSYFSSFNFISLKKKTRQRNKFKKKKLPIFYRRNISFRLNLYFYNIYIFSIYVSSGTKLKKISHGGVIVSMVERALGVETDR